MTVVLSPATPGARPFAEYAALDAETIRARTWAAKERLGKRVVVLGHHYQRESVVEFADFRGDSFKLSQLAAAQAEAEFIVFCGVHFMAESADILRQPHQTVILPDMKAGCSMADMADMEHVEATVSEDYLLADAPPGFHFRGQGINQFHLAAGGIRIGRCRRVEQVVNDFFTADGGDADLLDFQTTRDIGEANRFGIVGASGERHAEHAHHHVARAGNVVNGTRTSRKDRFAAIAM